MEGMGCIWKIEIFLAQKLIFSLFFHSFLTPFSSISWSFSFQQSNVYLQAKQVEKWWRIWWKTRQSINEGNGANGTLMELMGANMEHYLQWSKHQVMGDEYTCIGTYLGQKNGSMGCPNRTKTKKNGLLLFWAESTKSAFKSNFKWAYLPHMDLVLSGSWVQIEAPEIYFPMVVASNLNSKCTKRYT